MRICFFYRKFDYFCTQNLKCEIKKQQNMKRIVIFSLALMPCLSVFAQVGHQDEQGGKPKNEAAGMFGEFKKKAKSQYEGFRQKANAEYAQFMEEAWKMYHVNEAEEIPFHPMPIEPLEHNAPVTNSRIDYDIVEEAPAEKELTDDSGQQSSRPEPMEPILPVFESDLSTQSLVLYGSLFPIHVEKPAEKVKNIKLKNLSERSVARMWRRLSCRYYDNVVAECLQQRENRNLCDWAYVQLTEKMANKYFSEGSNEAVVLQMYLLTQSGYQMRIARAEDKLTLLMGSDEKIYRYKYFVIEGIQFYILDRSMQNKSMDVYDRAFPGEKSLSLVMTQPEFSIVKTASRTLTAKHYPSLSVSVETNRNLMDFYDDYPLTSHWTYYANASMSNVVKESLYPAIQDAIEGKSELEAANIILDFVQTSLSYSRDQEQFGYERPLYPDEALYYPSCDCEDRSILFSCLVRELLGLDVVLLNYPSHITTAVRFSDEVKGDFLTIDDQKYVICEPTFTKGAPVGYSAEKLKTVKPKVIKL